MSILVRERETVELGNEISPKIAREIEGCRSCGSVNIKDIFSLGNVKVARFSENETAGPDAPLTFSWCPDCTYFQLRHNIDIGLVFYDEYGYESGVNPIMVNELRDVIETTRAKVDMKDGDAWVDIASNDGTLLLQIEGNITRVGFDPSRNVAMKGAERLIEKFGTEASHVFADYFDSGIWKRTFGEKKAKVISAIAVFYSVQEPGRFLTDVKSVLSDDGIFVVQQNYTPEMVKQLAFCNIVHEHVTYPTFTAFKNLVERHGFEVVDVTVNDINGGSFRTFLKHAGSSLNVEGADARINTLLRQEAEKGYLKEEVYVDFARRIFEGGNQVSNYLKKEVDQGKRVYGLAASTRGNTRLQVWGLGPDLISGIAERNPRKIGKKTLGIPIVSDEEALANADILFVSIWFYGSKIANAYKGFLEKGGTMLFPSSSNGEPYLVRMENGRIVEEKLPSRE